LNRDVGFGTTVGVFERRTAAVAAESVDLQGSQRDHDRASRKSQLHAWFKGVIMVDDELGTVDESLITSFKLHALDFSCEQGTVTELGTSILGRR
jgi:hypothetical protein